MMTKQDFIQKKIEEVKSSISYWEAELAQAHAEKSKMTGGESDLEFSVIDARIRHAGSCIDELIDIDLEPLERGELHPVKGRPLYEMGDAVTYDFFYAGEVDLTGSLSAFFSSYEEVPAGGVFKDLANPSLNFVKLPDGRVRTWVYDNPEII
jgi:hypothetical protein